MTKNNTKVFKYNYYLYNPEYNPTLKIAIIHRSCLASRKIVKMLQDRMLFSDINGGKMECLE